MQQSTKHIQFDEEQIPVPLFCRCLKRHREAIMVLEIGSTTLISVIVGLSCCIVVIMFWTSRGHGNENRTVQGLHQMTTGPSK